MRVFQANIFLKIQNDRLTDQKSANKNQNNPWLCEFFLPQILLYVLLVGHFPFNDWSMPSEQTEMDRIIAGSVGQGPKVWNRGQRTSKPTG